MNNKEIEEWRSIDDYEGLYEVSSLGRVRSLNRLVNGNGGMKLRKGRILKQKMNNKGYLHVVLCKNDKQNSYYIHRLVASAFQEICGQFREELQVDHIDTNPLNNRAENLRFCTHKENCGNELSRKHYSDSNKTKCKSGKDNPKSKSIIQMDRQGNFLAEFDCIHEAERKFGINHGNLWSALNGRLKTAGGFKWKYKTA